jgi:glutamate N-acetyltransferase/amino-acid N-acetyltransferase
MIHPDMATMLAFIATDANIPEPHLRKMLGECINTSFNRISVDGDTSTNDACVLTATGQARGGPTLTPQHPHWAAIVDGVGRVCEALAKSIVRDGEGATKFIEVVVDSPAQAASLAIATTVAQSPLVKTALFASDPNWGRILAAVGRAPVDSMRVEDISIWLDEYQIIKNGEPSVDYQESEARRIVSKQDITIRVLLGRGGCRERMWTCDLSYDYVRINAEYRS